MWLSTQQPAKRCKRMTTNQLNQTSLKITPNRQNETKICPEYQKYIWALGTLFSGILAHRIATYYRHIQILILNLKVCHCCLCRWHVAWFGRMVFELCQILFVHIIFGTQLRIQFEYHCIVRIAHVKQFQTKLRCVLLSFFLAAFAIWVFSALSERQRNT